MRVRNLLNDIDALLEPYKTFQETLLTSRHTVSESSSPYHILTCSSCLLPSSYVLRNTIELRRIAQHYQADIEEQKKLSASSQRESHGMAKIASLTMLYLPASFVAVSHPCFSKAQADSIG
jgi:hypothetical protein